MPDYPPPSYAATVWVRGDKLVMRFVSPLGETGHCVEYPMTEKGLQVALFTLRERAHAQQGELLIGNRGAPTTYMTERQLAEDTKYNEWIKAMKQSKAERDAQSALDDDILKELAEWTP